MPKDENNICDDCGELDTTVCFICHSNDYCVVCDACGEYGPGKRIVCPACRPHCYECGKKLELRADTCCGQGRSDDGAVIIVLPCFGEPYVWKAKVFEGEPYAELDKIVQGKAELEWKRSLRIHPMFEGRWGLIRELLSNKKHLDYITIHTNVKGEEVCSANMACVALSRGKMGGPFFGDVALVIPVSCFDNKISVKMFMPVKLPHPWDNDDDEMMGHYEPDDDDDEKKLNEWCKEHGYDYHESTGQVYEKPIKKPLRIVDKF